MTSEDTKNLPFRFQPLSGQPIYLQIAQAIAAQIREGKLRKGDPLPSVSDFAKSNRLSNSTVGRAYQILAKKRITRNKVGTGSEVISEDVSKILPFQ